MIDLTLGAARHPGVFTPSLRSRWFISRTTKSTEIAAALAIIVT